MNRYVCIHGHFYQPPRENPWLEAIEVQDSAYPYHDWNERITAECYGPNATSRILDGEDRIVRIVNNYARISFNFGPTLLTWMEAHDPEVYAAILAADRESRKTFSGHGSALAQAYNHLILPLANRRDKVTQVHWGIEDFRHRFGRLPEGMWLPETAVDLETLDVLAELGIRFTLLAPRQAGRVRPLTGSVRAWRDPGPGGIDPTTAYLQRLPSGRTITLFFYDGPLSQGLAFEGLLHNGEHFARRLTGAFLEARPWPQLVHVATDGETYGHHHRHGDMALAYALHYIEANRLARLTNYGEFLDRHPPPFEVEVRENTSWSCAHGVERWRSDCGCNLGSGAGNGRAGWNQAWRAPLRAALDWLRDALAPRFEDKGRRLLKDPWAARNDYSAVILDRSPEVVGRFLDRHAARALTDPEKSTALKLLEMQRQALLMYTSCGWFFDELSGIETVQVMRHAARALRLADELFGAALEAPFMEKLAQARSNLPEHGDGRRLYEEVVRPAAVEGEQVAAHFAMSSFFQDHPDRSRVYSYTVDREDWQSRKVGRARLLAGKVRVASTVTLDSEVLDVAFVHFGGHNLFGGVGRYPGDDEYRAWVHDLDAVFAEADFPETITRLDRHFGGRLYSLKSLLKDEQRRILNQLSEAALAEAEGLYRQLYKEHTPLLYFVTDLGIPLKVLSVPLPRALQTAAEFVLNIDLRRAFEDEGAESDQVRALLKEAGRWQVALDSAGLGYVVRQAVERQADRLRAEPFDLSLLKRLEDRVGLARSLPFEVDFRKTQNRYYELLQTVWPRAWGQAEQGDQQAQTWAGHFAALGKALRVRVDPPQPTEAATASQLAVTR